MTVAHAAGTGEAPGTRAVGTLDQPKGFFVLAATEMLERYAYFGCRALLVLYLVAATGGGMAEAEAVAIFGLFSAATYLAGLPGGYIGDQWLGAQRAIVLGGILIILGNLLLALPLGMAAFYAGLWVIVAGVGILKPNISAMVASLYTGQEDRLDGAFTLYYMGVCIGAAAAAIIAPVVAIAFGWHWGFAASGAGMAIGLAVFLLGRKALAGSGQPPAGIRDRRARGQMSLTVSIFALVAVLAAFGQLPGTITDWSIAATWAIVLLGCGFFVWVLGFAGLAPLERRRIWACFVLCLACAAYWSGADLAGSSLTLFAQVHTDRSVSGLSLGSVDLWSAFSIPAGTFQSINPVLIVLLAPFLTMFWDFLARRRRLPGAATKFAGGLIFAGLSMVVMMVAAQNVSGGAKVGPGWLLGTYFLLTIGEMLLSPVGLAAINRLAPVRLAGRLMGAWFLSVALGTLIASRLASYFPSDDPVAMYYGYGMIAAGLFAGGTVLLVFARRIAALSDDPLDKAQMA